MKVKIKDFKIDMEVKNSGLEFEVRSNNDEHRGDAYVTKSGLTWCNGKTTRAKGTKVTWDEFIEWMNS